MTPEKLKHVAWIAVKAVLRAQRLQVHANETACSAIAVEAVGPIDFAELVGRRSCVFNRGSDA